MDRLRMRAGKAPAVVAPPTTAQAAQRKVEPVVAAPVPEKKPFDKSLIEEVRPATPEPQAPARGGLSSLLGGWWGKS